MKILFSIIAVSMLSSVSHAEIVKSEEFYNVNGFVSYELAQFNNFSTSTTDKKHSTRPRHERNICVIQPRESSESRRPIICRTDSQRIGGSCRCTGAIGSGTVQSSW